MRRDLRATWKQALLGFAGPLIAIFVIRWLLLEPYVIPSGSMIPTLWIHDHIFVNKLAYGVHFPMSKAWIVHWSSPQKNEIVVFRYPESPEVFYVKRVVATAGDQFEIKSGAIYLNGEIVPQQPVSGLDSQNEGFVYFQEEGRQVRYLNHEDSNFGPFTVPEGHFFVVGDNRDQSNDSRFWGSVPVENVIGRASMIWLSCEETLPSARFLCDPKTLRFNRIFKLVH